MDENRPYFLDTLVVGALQINCYLFGCAKTRHAAIIDPGGDADLIVEKVTERDGTVGMILLTHGHFDHLGAVADIKEKYKCPIMIHVSEQDALINPMVNLSALAGENIVCPPADQFLDDGEKIMVGLLPLEVIYTPGHSRGSLCFRYDDILFSGDALFNSGIGRTDLPGGDFRQLERSIQSKIYSLPDSTIVYPGHGEPTTVGAEKKLNPYVRVK